MLRSHAWANLSFFPSGESARGADEGAVKLAEDCPFTLTLSPRGEGEPHHGGALRL
jgi:hypothetical protein